MSTDAPPGTAADIRDALAAISTVSSGGGAHDVDGLRPDHVVTPASFEEAAAVLKVANANGSAVIPWGGGRHMALGNIPRRYDIALSTEKLDHVLAYEPADLTITVEAGITMGRLQVLLAERGQFLPIDAPPDATVGGVLAAGVSGPSRHAYGLPRDWLLGCRFVLADGNLVKGGGRVVKNVAGYDLPKLAVGSLGTLGLIVEATFKVAPLPAVQETLLLACATRADAGAAMFAADELSLALRAVALIELSTAALWLAGPAAAVQRTLRELERLAADAKTERLVGTESEAWWSRLDGATRAPDGGCSLRTSLPRSQTVAFVQGLDGLAHDANMNAASMAYPTTGLVLTRLSAAGDEQLAAVIEGARRLATQADGSLVVTAAPLAVKTRIDVWGGMGDARPTMTRLKQQFDARGTLNPGRFVGGI